MTIIDFMSPESMTQYKFPQYDKIDCCRGLISTSLLYSNSLKLMTLRFDSYNVYVVIDSRNKVRKTEIISFP